MRKLWSNLMPGLPVNFREQIAEQLEQTADKMEKTQKRGVESQLWAAAQRSYTEDATDPMAPQDYDVRQSGRVLETPKTVISGCDRQICLGTFPSS